MTKKIINNKNIILIILLIVVAGSIYYLNSQKASPSNFKTTQVDIAEQKEEQGVGTQNIGTDYIVDENAIRQKSLLYLEAPELRSIAGYINTDPDIKIQNLKGNVVLVDFWTYTCINCIRTMPYLKSWYDQYTDDGLVIVGVHTPEFEFEKDIDNVQDAVDKYDLKYAVVQDNDYATWRAYKNRWWPRKYLIDIDGFIRYDHIGEGGYTETESVIQELLNEKMEREGDLFLLLIVFYCSFDQSPAGKKFVYLCPVLRYVIKSAERDHFPFWSYFMYATFHQFLYIKVIRVHERLYHYHLYLAFNLFQIPGQIADSAKTVYSLF